MKGTPEHAFLDAFPEPLLLVAPNGRLLAVNHHAGQLLGLAGCPSPAVTLAELTQMPPASVTAILRECLTVTTPVPLRLSFFPTERSSHLYTCDGWRCTSAATSAAFIRIHRGEERASRFMELTHLIDTLNRECAYRQRSEERLRATLGQLHEILDLREHILRQVSHDLRTPLNAVLGMSEFILQQPFGPLQPRYHDYISDIHFSGRTLLELVDQVLRFSNGEATTPVETSNALADLSECLENCYHVVEPIARQRDLHVMIPDLITLPRLYADQTLVKQILLNLMGNAAKYVQDGGRIEVRAEWECDALAIKVIDNGPGIPRERLRRALDTRRLKDADFLDTAHGASIGLSLSRRSAELIGGRLEIRSRVGRGTTAALILPRPLLAADGSRP